MKCLYPKCNSPAKNRGLCQNCYMLAYRLIASGKTSDEELVADGKMLRSSSTSDAAEKRSWFIPPPPPPKKFMPFDEAIRIVLSNPTAWVFVGHASRGLEVPSASVAEWLKELKQNEDAVEFHVDGEDGGISFGMDFDGLVQG